MRRDRRPTAAVLALAVAFALAAPGAAVAEEPPVDEYTLDIPKPNGDGGGGGSAAGGGPASMQARTYLLPAPVREDLAGAPDGSALGRIATAPGLGAPDGRSPSEAGSGNGAGDAGGDAAASAVAPEERGVGAVILGTVDDGGLPAVLAAVALIAAAGGWLVARRRYGAGARE